MTLSTRLKSPNARVRSRKTAWAIKWVDDSPFSPGGHRERLIGGARFERPRQFGGYVIMAFATRREARAYRDEHYGYIRDRADLRSSPHCWKLPRIVRVNLIVEEAA